MAAQVYDWKALSDPALKVRGKDRVLQFKVTLESMYYPAGLLREVRGHDEYYRVVRCRVGETCKFDVPAKLLAGEEYEAVLPKSEPKGLLFLEDRLIR